jgi:hypothetical protein
MGELVNWLRKKKTLLCAPGNGNAELLQEMVGKARRLKFPRVMVE